MKRNWKNYSFKNITGKRRIPEIQKYEKERKKERKKDI